MFGGAAYKKRSAVSPQIVAVVTANDGVAALTNSRLGFRLPRSLAATVVDQCFMTTDIDRLTIVQSLNAALELVVQEDASWGDKHPCSLRVCRR